MTWLQTCRYTSLEKRIVPLRKQAIRCASLGSLSAEQQIIVIGRFLAGQKIEDLAQALGKQPGAVRVSQFRALNALAKHLGLARESWRSGKGERA